MSFEGFHVSKHKYEIGNLVSIEAGRVTHFHRTLEREGNVAGENRLKPYKPADAPCRTNCIYVFGELGDCSIYGSSEHLDAKPHYYRVKFEGNAKVPMVLVDFIRKQVDPTDKQVAIMASEYWNPTLDWEFWEYLTDAIEILEEVEPLDMGSMEAITSRSSFDSDCVIAATFCAEIMKTE